MLGPMLLIDFTHNHPELLDCWPMKGKITYSDSSSQSA